MMRYLLLFAIVLIAVPAQAQRVFRASSIDMEQNERIDVLESKIDLLEGSIDRLITAMERPAPVVAAIPKPKPVVVAVVKQSLPVAVTYAPTYAPSRNHWTYPGDIRSHLASSHGTVNTAGMTRDQMESLHDSLHERSPQRVQQTVCPNGVCPTSSRSIQRTYQRTGLFGWRR